MAQHEKCCLGFYRDFLIANSNRYSGVELAKVEPSERMTHDSVTRYLAGSDTGLTGYEALVRHWHIEVFHEGLRQTTGVGN